jgi:hypothetical protein
LPIIFADDTSILVSHFNINDFNNIFSIFEILNKWFEANKLTLNYNKPQCIQFATKTKMLNNFIINYNNKSINSTFCTKFLEIMVEGTLSWKDHVEILKKKLISVLKVIYYSFFHLLMSYGIIFWGNSSYNYTIFLLQKKAIRAMLGYGNTVSCRNMFKELGILPLASQYLFSLLQFVSYNKALFSSNIDSHIFATRQSQDLYLPQANLTVYQKGVYYVGIKMFNKLPTEIKSIYNNFKGLRLYYGLSCLLVHFILWMNI